MAGIAPVLAYHCTSQYNPPDEREAGTYDYFFNVYKEKMNAIYLGAGHAGPAVAKMNYFTNIRVEKPADLAGQRVRTSPMYEAFLNALGVNQVSMPMTEIYSAMDRNVIDGFVMPLISGVGTGWKMHEVADYMISQGFLHMDQCTLVNLDKWNQLPKDKQDLLLDVGREMEYWVFYHFSKLWDTELATVKAGGMEIIDFSPADAERFYQLSYTASWDAMKEKLGPETYQELLPLLQKK